MVYNNETLYKGLHLMYIGELVTIVGLVSGLVVIIVPGALILGVLILLASLVGVVIGVVGLFKLRNEHADYMNALIILVVAFVCGIIGNQMSGFLSVLFDLVNSVLGLVRLYLVIRATNTFLTQAGRMDVAEKGKMVLYIEVVSVVVTLLSNVLTIVLSENLGGLLVLLVILSLVVIVSEAMYIIYLKSSSEALC